MPLEEIEDYPNLNASGGALFKTYPLAMGKRGGKLYAASVRMTGNGPAVVGEIAAALCLATQDGTTLGLVLAEGPISQVLQGGTVYVHFPGGLPYLRHGKLRVAVDDNSSGGGQLAVNVISEAMD